jgi:hypothetical protein
MGIGVSLFLIAVGLILWLAVNVDTEGALDVNMVGIILVIVGLVGMLLSLIFCRAGAASAAGGARRSFVTTATTARLRTRPSESQARKRATLRRPFFLGLFSLVSLEDPDKQKDDENDEKKCPNADVHSLLLSTRI